MIYSQDDLMQWNESWLWLTVDFNLPGLFQLRKIYDWNRLYKELLFSTISMTHQYDSWPSNHYQWVIFMTHRITLNHLESKSLIWVSFMTHLEYALKSGIQNYVLPYICVGGTSKLENFSYHQLSNFICYKLICILCVLQF